jgi:hypothetical protein
VLVGARRRARERRLDAVTRVRSSMERCRRGSRVVRHRCTLLTV